MGYTFSGSMALSNEQFQTYLIQFRGASTREDKYNRAMKRLVANELVALMFIDEMPMNVYIVPVYSV